MRIFSKAFILPVSMLLMTLSTSVVAKEKPEWRSWPLGDRLIGTVGYYWTRLDTNAAVSDADGNLGALISFEDTLGLDDNKGTAIAGIRWRISKRNAVGFNYFKLNRSATQNSTIEIFVPNPTPPPDSITATVTLPLAAKFDIESFDITYAFSVIFTEKMNLGLGIGLALQQLNFGYQATDDCVLPECTLFGDARAVDSTAPLPTLKITYEYAINDKWLLDANLGYLDLDFELDDNESLGGRIFNGMVGIRWKTWDHVGFNLAYKAFDVELDYAKRSLRAGGDYRYRGFAAGIQAYF